MCVFSMDANFVPWLVKFTYVESQIWRVNYTFLFHVLALVTSSVTIKLPYGTGKPGQSFCALGKRFQPRNRRLHRSIARMYHNVDI